MIKKSLKDLLNRKAYVIEQSVIFRVSLLSFKSCSVVGLDIHHVCLTDLTVEWGYTVLPLGTPFPQSWIKMHDPNIENIKTRKCY